MFKKYWWKFLGALLILYSIVVGLYIPLGPGIMYVSPAQLKQGQSNTITIKGHGTHFKDNSQNLQVWVNAGGKNYCGKNLEVKNNEVVMATFNIPTLNPKDTLTLIINNEKDGTVALGDAFWFDATKMGTEITDSTGCEVAVKTNTSVGTHFPFLKILFQTIRNLFYHVCMWFSMIGLLIGGMVYSILYLKSGERKHDIWASQITGTAMFLGVLGVTTGMLWATFTWGHPWPNDPKLNSVAIGMLMYSAYFILRGAIDDEEKRARISAVTNIFFFPIFIVLIFVLPRLTDSLHPGNGGNPGFGQYDLDSTMRLIFYPAVIGWTLLGYWISQLKARVRILETSDDE